MASGMVLHATPQMRMLFADTKAIINIVLALFHIFGHLPYQGTQRACDLTKDKE